MANNLIRWATKIAGGEEGRNLPGRRRAFLRAHIPNHEARERSTLRMSKNDDVESSFRTMGAFLHELEALLKPHGLDSLAIFWTLPMAPSEASHKIPFRIRKKLHYLFRRFSSAKISADDLLSKICKLDLQRAASEMANEPRAFSHVSEEELIELVERMTEEHRRESERENH